MSWFDRLFGEEQTKKPRNNELMATETDHQDEDHTEIYRRPKGKFRFPVNMGDAAAPAETSRTKQITNELVSDAYFEEKRARRQQRHAERVQRKSYYETSQPKNSGRHKGHRVESRSLQPRENIHRPRFVSSEVPSAIYGSRKHLKPSDRQVVITPLMGGKPETKQPEVPPHRKTDNMVNIENIYASQIVEEIRKEREKKAKRLHEAQTVDIETETLEYVETHESDGALEIAEVHIEEPENESIWVETVSAENFEEDMQKENFEGDASGPSVQDPELADAQEIVTDVQETAPTPKRKSSPFNVVMTPSDKRRLMEKQQSMSTKLDFNEDHKDKDVQTETSSVEQPDDAALEKSTAADEINSEAEQSTASQPTIDAAQADETSSQMNTKPLPSILKDTKRVEKRKGPNYLLPPVSLLQPMEPLLDDFEWVDEQKRQLDDAFYHFNVPAKVENVVIGPSVTRYELSVEKGVKVSRITNLQDDIKLALAAKDIRIEAPIPGTSRVGVEVPNTETRKINLSEILFSKRFKFAESKLMVGLGVKINNEPMLMDIAKMPHALIAGATGSGKSVSINAILLSLLYRNNPNELKLLLIDPKMVELAPYNDLPHLIAPVITDVKAATESLKWAVEEMERRYQMFADVHVRNITAYNQKSPYDKRLPKIVIIIDELADLMMMAPQEVEHSIARIAQKARAAGIHMILATQRPSVNVITGLIKANVPTRIAFMVSSSIDSRTVLDAGGAEKLLGNGDMLYQGNGMSKPIRVQGAYVSDSEIDNVVAYIKSQAGPNYLFGEKDLLDKVNEIPQDDLFEDVIELMREEGQISTSQVQRRFQIGYNRAARIIDSLESLGYISGPNGSKPRKVLMTDK